MWKIIQFIFTGCWHKWQHVETCGLRGDGGATGRRIMHKCTRCGRHKKQDVI